MSVTKRLLRVLVVFTVAASGCTLALSSPALAARGVRITPLESADDCGGVFYSRKVFTGDELFQFSYFENERVGKVGINGRAVSVTRVSFNDKNGMRFVYSAGRTKVSFFSKQEKSWEEGSSYRGTLKVETATGSASAVGEFYVGC